MSPTPPDLTHECVPARGILTRVGDKWSMLIVLSLSRGPLRFTEIKRQLGSVSQRMLTRTLRGLERDSVLTRTVTPLKPPRVDYELTALGHSLHDPVERLAHWAIDHQAIIEAAQFDFDTQASARADKDAT